MSWNLIYYGNFGDNANKDRVDIYIKQKDFLGTPEKLLLDANPLVISYPSKDFMILCLVAGVKLISLMTAVISFVMKVYLQYLKEIIMLK